MKSKLERRKILIVEDQPAITRMVHILLASMGCECSVASGGEQALGMIQEKKYDAVLLDLRCTDLRAEEVVSGIKEIRPNLVGRVLVINGEFSDRATMELIERHSLQKISRYRLLQELWTGLESLFQVRQVA